MAANLLQLPVILVLAAVGVYCLPGALSSRFPKMHWGRGLGGAPFSRISHLAVAVYFGTFAFLRAMSLWHPINHVVALWILGSELAFLMLMAMVDGLRHWIATRA